MGEGEEQPTKHQRREESTSIAVESPSHKVTSRDEDDSGSSSRGAEDPLEVVPLQAAPPFGGSEFRVIALQDEVGSEEIDDQR